MQTSLHQLEILNPWNSQLPVDNQIPKSTVAKFGKWPSCYQLKIRKDGINTGFTPKLLGKKREEG